MTPELEAKELAHARSRDEADAEVIKLCALLVVAFGYPIAAPLLSGQRLDSAAITCGVIALGAIVVLLREGFERVRPARLHNRAPAALAGALSAFVGRRARAELQAE